MIAASELVPLLGDKENAARLGELSRMVTNGFVNALCGNALGIAPCAVTIGELTCAVSERGGDAAGVSRLLGSTGLRPEKIGCEENQLVPRAF